MKTNILILFFILIFTGNVFSKPDVKILPNSIPQAQVLFDPNNIATWIQNTGIFDQDIRTNNTPGLMWLRNSNRFAIFTAGFTMGAYVNNSLRLASCSYRGEYQPGRCTNGVPYYDADFHLYKVHKIDSPSNPDYANWYKMIPYGAPYIDINNNGTYDNGIDKPGVKDAEQTVFICMTDGYPENHTSSEGFSGGTAPLFSEMRLTAWGYTNPAYADIQFLKFQIINKGTASWDSLHGGIMSDPDLGSADDDYIGCDTLRQMGYVYNADNDDGNGNPPTYGINPPAAGMIMHKGFKINNIGLNVTSFVYFTGTGSGGILCMTDPNFPIEAYTYLKGYKKDGSPWFHPGTHQRTKKVYTGAPETNLGWTEFGINGVPGTAQIQNCLGGDSITTSTSPPGDRRFLVNTGSLNLKVNPGDTQTVIMSQLVARGTNNLNSVLKLRQLADAAWELFNSGFTIGIQNISTEVPADYKLYQNYPNPFNPVTKIKFDIKLSDLVKLTVYDLQGREVTTLINENLKPGTYEISFDGSTLASGVYFYKLETNNRTLNNKMLLIK